VEWALRRVDRDQWIVNPEPITLRVSVGEEASLEDLVRREADPGNDVRRREGGLLDLGKEVLRVTVQFHLTNLDQRVVRVRPYLGQIEGMNAIGVGIFFVHDLDKQLPAGKFAPLDRFEKVPLIALAIARDDLCRLGVCQVLNTLLCFERKFHPEALVFRVEEAICVAPKTIHMAKGPGNASVAHGNGDLVQRLGKV
jgi:hypothetical protein